MRGLSIRFLHRRLRILLLLFLPFLIEGSIQAQISQGGTPLAAFQPELISELVFEQMPLVDVARLHAEDILFDQNKSIPWRFGENIPVDIHPGNVGHWTDLDEMGRVWTCGIQSQGALSLNLTFDDFQLPQGARLFVYSPDMGQVIGAFTEHNNHESRVFATTLIRSETIILEYFEPLGVSFPGKLHLARVTHGYRDAFSFAKSFGSSGSCNNNVACPESAGWENQIRSACMLVVGGNGFCSGSVVNNTSQDGTPYVLTANHCSTGNDFASWVFWFNWQSPTCANPPSSPAYQSISGSSLKARNAGSDFCLVLMNNPPPNDYGVYYSGWDHSDSLPTRQVGIHHPSGDIKKISFDNNPATQTNWGSPVAACWQIGVWDDGTTEGGSSGSPLYDQNNRIIGQLYGGYASCTSLTSDYYGRFATSWDAGTTPATRLKDWLDPGNAGVDFIDGWDSATPVPPVAGFSINQGNGCSGTVQFENQSTGNPVSWLWYFGDGATSTQSNPSHTYTQNGSYLVSLVVSNSMGSDSIQLADTVFINMPQAPVAIGDSICDPGTLALSASGLGRLNWYSEPTGGLLLDTGAVYLTPFLAQSTTYWVEDEVFSVPQFVGKVDNSGGGAYYTQNQLHYMRFDVLSPCTLKSVKVYAGNAGNRVISLRNSSGAVLEADTIFIPAGESRINLNYPLQPGTGYRLQAPASPNLYRNNAGAVYPYTLSGVLSIVGSSATQPAYYYYFYDWEVVTSCISPRVPVEAIIGSSALQIQGGDSLHACEGELISIQAVEADTYLWSNGSSNQAISLIPQNGDTYAVTISLDACVGIDSASIAVHPFPLANAGPDVEVCEGGTVQLLASGGTIFSWSNGAETSGIEFEPLESGSYSVTVSNGFCESVDQVMVSVFPLPAISLGSDTVVCIENGPVMLQPGTGFVSYQWSTGETSPQVSVGSLIPQAMNYSVTVTDVNGCQNFDQVNIMFQICGGWENMNGDGEFLIYPQPAGEEFRLKVPDSFKVKDLWLSDPTGRIFDCPAQVQHHGLFRISVAHLASGLYFLKLSGETQTLVKPIMIR